MEQKEQRFAHARAFLTVDAAEELGGLRREIQALRSEVRQAIPSEDQRTVETRPSDLDRKVRTEIAKLIKMLGQLKGELAQLKHPAVEKDKFHTAASELDMIVTSTEDATAIVLAQTELIQAATRRLSEGGDSTEVSQEIECAALEIMQACSFQDLTGQRTTKVVRALREVEERVATMVEIWGREAFLDMDVPQPALPLEDDAVLLNGPSAPGAGLSQDDIDALFD